MRFGYRVGYDTEERARSDLLSLAWWYEQFSAEAWRETLAEGLTDEQVARIRLRTHTGRPLDSDAFLSKLETLLGRRLHPLPVRRPRKSQENDARGRKVKNGR